MFKLLITTLVLVSSLSANENFAMFYDVTKGKKELGKYEISIEESDAKLSIK